MWGGSYYTLTIRYDSLTCLNPPTQPAKPITFDMRHVEPFLLELDLIRDIALPTRHHEDLVRHVDCILHKQVAVLDITKIQDGKAFDLIRHFNVYQVADELVY